MTRNNTTLIRRSVSVLWDVVCICLSVNAAKNSLWYVFVGVNLSILQRLDEFIQSIRLFPSTFFSINLIGAILCLIGATVHIVLFLRKRTQLAKKFRFLQNLGALIIVFSSIAYFFSALYNFNGAPR